MKSSIGENEGCQSKGVNWAGTNPSTHLRETWLSHNQVVDVELAHHHEDSGDDRVDEGRVLDVHVDVVEEEELGKGKEHDPENDAEVNQTAGAIAECGGQHGHPLVETQQSQELQGREEHQPPQHVSEQLVPVTDVLEPYVLKTFGLLELLG